MSASIDQALLLTATHFRGVVDKGGQPYILHCLRVMLNFNESAHQQVGLMHDLIEDTSVSLDDLRQQGFSCEVIEAVDLMTHQSEMSYADYVIRLKPNEIARQVKMADLRDNGSLSRVAFRSDHLEKDSLRMRKYIHTYHYLSDQISETDYRRLMADVE